MIMPDIFFDPVTGASGNMILGSLLDLDVPVDAIAQPLHQAGLHGFDIVFARRQDRHHIESGHCEVNLTGGHHEHGGGHHGEHHHPHRRLPDIEELIDGVQAPDRVRHRARTVFRRLAEAEAAVHGTPVDQVHFHEVGAVDAIVDIVGTCLALEYLQVESIYCGTIPTGQGTIRCAHGVMPVPAPATVRLLKGRPVKRLSIDAELTTPTGAALLTGLAAPAEPVPAGCLLGTGSGHGSRDLEEQPNILRAFLLETRAASTRCESVTVLETDIDDESPEVLADLVPRLLRQGALDASMTALTMKKGRPGVRLTVLALPAAAAHLAAFILERVSSLGVRQYRARRTVLSRTADTVDTPWGQVDVKAVSRRGGIELIPEYESCRRLADEADVPLRNIMQAARRWRGKEECQQ